MCSYEHCPALEEARYHNPEKVEEENPEKLSLALEPESAAIYCQYKSQMQSSNSDDEDSNKKSTSYLIVDIGGGTMDISAHCLVRDPEPHIKVIHEPTGNDCGGVRINENFEAFLEDLVRDPKFHRFLTMYNEIINSRHQNFLDQLIHENFETQKKIFGEMFNKYKGIIELPQVFFKTYKDDLNQSIAEKSELSVRLVEQSLRISPEVMGELFEKVVKSIIKGIDDTLEDLEHTVKLIYFVGGFGGSKYVEKVVGNAYKKKNIECIFPLEPAYAVAKGAALFRMNPTVIESRKVDATYGIGTTIPFVEGLHNPKYKFTDDDGYLKCNHIFKTVVEKGDVVGTGEVFSVTLVPLHHNQTSMSANFYFSQERDIFYVTGERGRDESKPRQTVTKLGEITVKMPVPDGDKNRCVDIMFNFSHTEIKVKAFDRASKTEVKAVFDFLTDT